MNGQQATRRNSTSLVVGETQTRPTARCRLTPVSLALLKKRKQSIKVLTRTWRDWKLVQDPGAEQWGRHGGKQCGGSPEIRRTTM